MSRLFLLSLTAAAAALTLGACSNGGDQAKAPEGAMEEFANRHAVGEAKDKADRVDAARAREAASAADQRQKVQADAGIARFEQAEQALENEASAKGE
jgi:hypothetical protein